MLRALSGKGFFMRGFPMFLKQFVAAALAAGVTAAAGAADAPQPPKPKPDDLVCTYERPTGSNVPRRICMTQSRRDQLTKDSQETMRRLQGPSKTPGARSSN